MYKNTSFRNRFANRFDDCLSDEALPRAVVVGVVVFAFAVMGLLVGANMPQLAEQSSSRVAEAPAGELDEEQNIAPWLPVVSGMWPLTRYESEDSEYYAFRGTRWQAHPFGIVLALFCGTLGAFFFAMLREWSLLICIVLPCVLAAISSVTQYEDVGLASVLKIASWSVVLSVMAIIIGLVFAVVAFVVGSALVLLALLLLSIGVMLSVPLPFHECYSDREPGFGWYLKWYFLSDIWEELA